MTDLLAAVIMLEAQAAGELDYFQGRAMHALFLDLTGRAEPARAQAPCATPVPTHAKLGPIDHANARPPRRRLCAASSDQPTCATRPTHRARPA